MDSYINISLLAKELGAPIAFYDLETTTFRGKSNFGITDVYAVLVPLDGPWLELGSLINPENAISIEAQEITGITQKMVKSQKNWGHFYAETFKCITENCWVAGFKNNSYDNHALVDEGLRYGVPVELPQKSIDVYKLYHQLVPTSSKKGTLLELATRCKIAVPANLHRSKPDVQLTIKVLNYLIDKFGVNTVACTINGVQKLTTKELARFVKKKQQVSVPQLSAAFGVADLGLLLYHIGEAIDERLATPGIFANGYVQGLLNENALRTIRKNTIVDLKEFQRFIKSQFNITVDLVQIRIFLMTCGVSWPSLKTQD